MSVKRREQIRVSVERMAEENLKERMFVLADMKKALVKERQEHKEAWNEEICWYGTPEERLEWKEKADELVQAINDAEDEMVFIRMRAGRAAVDSWRAEYINR